jgi:hypothetical protein
MERLLAEVFADVRDALRDSSLPCAPTVLRASLLARGPSRLGVSGVFEPGAGGARDPELPSTTAWRWLKEGRGPCLVDTVLELTAALGDSPEAAGPLRLQGATQTLLQQRDSTHALVLPVASPDSDGLWGLLSVEVQALDLQAPGETHRRLSAALAPLGSTLMATIDHFLPMLLRMHAEASPELSSHPLLPVVGKRTAPLFDTLRKLAQFRNTILISGEPGVGKSRLARWIHEISPRATKPWRVVHLANIPETLIDGELYGWEAGAHTQAHSARAGVLPSAEGGTVFLDEIDRASLYVQDKLLQVLEDSRYRALGSDTGAQLNVRFIVGTNADLGQRVREGRFRRDLFDRISGVAFEVPPLRSRRDELGAWARHFAKRVAANQGSGASVEFTDAAIQWLGARPWEGNLRELDQLVTHAWMHQLDLENPGASLVITVEALVAAASWRATVSEESRVLASLRAAAREWVVLCEQRMAQGRPPPGLDWGKAFGAAVLLEATERLGRDEGFRLLGLGGHLKNRNHHNVWIREDQRWTELCSELDPA